jgi:hypothetical protein
MNKYTQGYSFHHDPLVDQQVRKVAERSVAAVVGLIPDVMAGAEREILDSLSLEPPSSVEGLRHQEHVLKSLSGLARARAALEHGVGSAVGGAFAELAHSVHQLPENLPVLEKERDFFIRHARVRLNLCDLLHIREMAEHNTNNCRPLLVHFNAQLAHRMGASLTHFPFSPLSPSVLLAGFVAGLQCRLTDLAVCRVLLNQFEKCFLSRLSVLLNNITLRLEEEGARAEQPIGFEEGVGGFLEQAVCHDQLLSFEGLSQVLEGLASIRSDMPVDELIGSLDHLRMEMERMIPLSYRQRTRDHEAQVLSEAREQISGYLNRKLSSRSLPSFLHQFFRTLWFDLLFEIMLSCGQEGSEWTAVDSLLDDLLDSVKPVETDEQRKVFSQQVSALLRQLREVLDRFHYRHTETANFFDTLKTLHLQILQQKTDLSSWEAWDPLPEVPPVPDLEPLLDARSEATLNRVVPLFS